MTDPAVAPDVWVDGMLVRSTLLTRLDSDWSVLIVRAPAGFGKSTLVQQWLRSRASVEAGQWSVGGKDVQVFDDFDRRDPMADRGLVDWIVAHPDTRAVVCLRSPERLDRRMFDGIAVHELDGRDLRFTVEEIRVLHSMLGVDAHPDGAEHLHRETGGWPAPTVAAVWSYRITTQSHDPWETAFATAEAEVAARVDELCAIARPGTVAGLAVQEVLTPESVAALALPDDWAAIDRLTAAGVLMSHDFSGRPMRAWPSTTQRVLQRKLDQEMPQLARELHLRMAEHHAGRMSTERELHHRAAAQDWDSVVEIVDTRWAELVGIGRVQSCSVLARIPRRQLREHPRAQLVAGLLLGHRDDDVLAIIAERRDAPGRSKDDHDTDTVAMMAARAHGLWRTARSLADRVAVEPGRRSAVQRLQIGITRMPPVTWRGQHPTSKQLTGTVSSAMGHGSPTTLLPCWRA